MCRHLLLGLCLTLFTVSGLPAQIRLSAGEKPLQLQDIGAAEMSVDQSALASVTQALPVKEWKTAVPWPVGLSMNEEKYLLLRLPLRPVARFRFLELRNPHLNHLLCWITDAQGRRIAGFPVTGDNTPFATRPLPVPGFVFPVLSSWPEDGYLVLATNHHFGKVDLPVQLHSTAGYLAWQHRQTVLMALMLGIGCFLLLAHLALWVFAGDSIYGWYSAYLITVLLYVACNLGWLFQYVYPGWPQLNDIIRPAVFALGLIPLLVFFQQLMNLKQHAGRLYLFNRWLMTGYGCLFLGAVISSIDASGALHFFWIRLNRLLIPLLMLYLVALSIYCLRRKLPFSGFALASFCSLFLFFFIYNLQVSGQLPQNGFTLHAQYVGLGLDCLIITASLGWRFLLYRREVQRLNDREIQTRQQRIAELAAYREEEMARLSAVLHDSVGSEISYLKIYAARMPLTEQGRSNLNGELKRVAGEVRAMSHAQSPLLLRELGLAHAMQHWSDQVAARMGWTQTDCTVYLPEPLPPNYDLIVYRAFQEMLQNVVRHSQATEVKIRLHAAEGRLTLSVANDGVPEADGVPVSAPGLGIRNLTHLMEMMSGRFGSGRKEKDGWEAVLELPLPVSTQEGPAHKAQF